QPGTDGGRERRAAHAAHRRPGAAGLRRSQGDAASRCPARSRADRARADGIAAAGGNDRPQPRRFRLIVRRAALRLAVSCAMALAATVSVAQVGGPARTEQEAETRRKLEAVRAQLRTLADEQRATRGERSEAERQLRERELAIARIAGELQDLDARVASEQRELDGLEARRKEFEQA